MSIERFPQSNQSNIIELNRTIAIRLLNAIEPQSNISNRGNVRLCSILFDYVPRIIHGFRVLKTKIRELEGGAYWGGNTVKAGKRNSEIESNQIR